MKKLLIAALAATALAGCGTHATPLATTAKAGVAAAKSADRALPVIMYVTANGNMGTSFVTPPNFPIRLQCYAMGDSFLTYTWNAWGPIFNFGPTATWTSPSMPGMYTVQVYVHNQQGQQVYTNLWFQVQPGARLDATSFSETQKDGALKPNTTGTTPKSAI